MFTVASQAAVAAEPDTALDVVLEQMAQRVAYRDDLDESEQQFLAAQGYSIGQKVHGKRSLVMRVFTSSRAARPSVLAFRGTVTSQIDTLLSDSDPRGIGADQLNSNRALIQQTLGEAAKNGRVILAGHSLGGAVAQLVAGNYPSKVLRVVTFHSPGTTTSLVASLRAYNQANPAQAVLSDHYQLRGDPILQVGQALIDGTVHDYKVAGGGNLSGMDLHGSYILADAALAHGRTLPVYDSGRGVVFVRDLPSSTKKTTRYEEAREVTGAAVTAGAAVVNDAEKGVNAAGKKIDKGLKDTGKGH